MARKRVCGKQCCNAKGTKCRCICDSRNHGSARVAVNQEQRKEGEAVGIVAIIQQEGRRQ